MKNVYAVIGANYGDEGKGLMTDYLSRQFPTNEQLIIRSNGGAQAGHTVNTGEQRHVFSHFGSGTFNGATTYLSKHFVVNPYLFYKECNEIQHTLMATRLPTVLVDPDALVTTPYDIFINQELENSRSVLNKHGSVGVGFGETIERSERFKPLTIKDLFNGNIDVHLKEIEEDWYFARYKELNLPFHVNYTDPSYLKDVRHKYEAWANYFRTNVIMSDLSTILDCALHYNTLIFEGAQGLLLDQNGDDFPHVTRSNTGLQNVVDIIPDDLEIENSTAIYVTRPYLTRHGAGPLINEVNDPNEIGFNVVDETNVHGEFQGHLRFAPLDTKAMMQRITADYHRSNFRKLKVAFTCVDQYNEPLDTHNIMNLADFVSTGPTHKDVTAFKFQE